MQREQGVLSQKSELAFFFLYQNLCLCVDGFFKNKLATYLFDSAKKSFLLYVAFAHMHVPLAFQTDVGFLPYQNALYELDETVKTIHQALIDSGVEENTLIWFSSRLFSF